MIKDSDDELESDSVKRAMGEMSLSMENKDGAKDLGSHAGGHGAVTTTQGSILGGMQGSIDASVITSEAQVKSSSQHK